ncbi:MAG: acetyltransferase [Candidatus Contendobacter sp.]|nr:acetyltransferase [Candidatus Contendobacter sp.]
MKIYLLGAANPETIRMIRAVQRSTSNVEFSGFLDNDPKKKNTNFYGFPVLGGLELVHELSNDNVGFVNLITGSTRTRYETSREIVASGGRLVNFIYPSIDLTMTRLGVGLYLQEAVIVQAGVEIGDNTSIHMGALIGHETRVGSSVFIAHAVSVSGCCSIGDGTFIGTNATILPRIKIGKWATIGAGAVIKKDVPDYGIAVGNPGRVIKFNEIPFSDGKIN